MKFSTVLLCPFRIMMVCTVISVSFGVIIERNHTKIARKTVKRFNRYSKLSPREAYKLEISILERLQQTPSPCNKIHVQELLNQHNKSLTFTTKWAGQTLDRGHKDFCRIPLDDLIEQANCIDEHLYRAGVRHVDQPKSGKNMALHGKHLTLIDFDIATLDDNPVLPEKYQKKDIAITQRFVYNYYRQHCK